MNAFMKDIKEQIDNSIAFAQKHGWTVKPGLWVSNSSKCCCPLGATVVEYYLKNKIEKIPVYSCDAMVTIIFNIHPDEAYSFANGFDGQPYLEKRDDYEFWKLGRDYLDLYGLEELPPIYKEFK